MESIVKTLALVAVLAATLYICIAGGEYTCVIAILGVIAITAIAVAMIAAALVREIYREVVKPVSAAIRRAF